MRAGSWARAEGRVSTWFPLRCEGVSIQSNFLTWVENVNSKQLFSNSYLLNVS